MTIIAMMMMVMTKVLIVMAWPFRNGQIIFLRSTDLSQGTDDTLTWGVNLNWAVSIDQYVRLSRMGGSSHLIARQRSQETHVIYVFIFLHNHNITNGGIIWQCLHTQISISSPNHNSSSIPRGGPLMSDTQICSLSSFQTRQSS